MDLLCPHCQKNLNIPDAMSGQAVRCPMCAASFTAPGLPPIFPEGSIRADMAPLLPPDLGLETEQEPPLVELSSDPSVHGGKPALSQAGTTGGYELVQESTHMPKSPFLPEAKLPETTPMPPTMPTPASASPPLAQPIGKESPAAPQADSETAPSTKPPPKSEYDHGFTLYFRRDVFAWIAPVGLTLLFLCSFFSWESIPVVGSPTAAVAPTSSANLWQMAFSRPSALFIVYLLLLLIAWPFSIAALLLQKKILDTPPTLKPVLPWSSLILTLVTLTGFFLFAVQYFYNNFYGLINPSTVWMKIAFRVHFLLVLSALVHFWLVRRAAKKMPEPRITLRW